MCLKILLSLFLFTWQPFLAANIPKWKDDTKVLLFLISGYRWDYTKDPFLVGIPRLIENGVQASNVTPTYPASSLTNMKSIVTGLYTENHGFVGNKMYHQDRDEFFLQPAVSSRSKPFWWNEAEPIWITAEKRGLRCALYWWPGCDVEIKGTRPKICVKYAYGSGTEREKKDMLLKVDEALKLFKKGELNLAQIYYGAVDDNGHKFGPDSPARRQALYLIDDVLDQVQAQIERVGLEDQVNILVTSDHGMTACNKESVVLIDLEKFSKRIKYQVDYETTSMILPKQGMLDKLYSELKHEHSKGLHIYKKKEIPEHYHIKGSDRVLPLLLQAKKGFLIEPLKKCSGDKCESMNIQAGVHGYDPLEVEDMRTVFFARGPVFKKGFTSPPLSNVDHYNLMCYILGMTPLPNNGSWEKVKTMLSDEVYLEVPNSGGVVKDSSCIIASIISMLIYHALA